MSTTSPFWTRLGEQICAPLYFSLCHWIRERRRDADIRKILFLARDGLILKKTWEALHGEDADTERLYLWASRRCLQIAGMQTIGAREKSFILSLKNLSPAQCLYQLGLELPVPDPDTGLAWDRPLASQRDKERFLAFLDSVSDSILAEARDERATLLAYLDSLGLLEPQSGKVGLVDLGWQGNLQAALQELLSNAGSGVQLQGFYMGTIAPVGVKELDRMAGLYFNRSQPGGPYRTIRYCRLLVEILFAAPHASVKRIRREGDGFAPEFVPLNEHADVIDQLMLMQEAALDCIRRNRDSWTANPDSIRDQAFRELARLLREPTPEEAGILGEIKHFGGFGQALDLHPLARPEAADWQLWHLRNEYRGAYWRKGFLVRLKPWQRLALAPLTVGMTLDRA
jgi:hypothetical protein